MERVILIRHGDDPADDRVALWLKRHGVPFEVLRPYLGEPLPDVDESVLASVIYGGKFDVFREDIYPFLHAENRWAEQCLKTETPLLGICQGAQTIAHVMAPIAARWDPLVYEFGYYELHPTEAGRELIPEGLHVVQAHYHGFDIPHGAERLAYSKTFPNQAMRQARMHGVFQFHPEVTEPVFRRWQKGEWALFASGRTDARGTG